MKKIACLMIILSTSLNLWAGEQDVEILSLISRAGAIQSDFMGFRNYSIHNLRCSFSQTQKNYICHVRLSDERTVDIQGEIAEQLHSLLNKSGAPSEQYTELRVLTANTIHCRVPLMYGNASVSDVTECTMLFDME